MPLFREKKPIEIDNQTLFESLKQRTNPKPKKPVKIFSWSNLKAAANLARSLSGDLGYKFKRIQELSEGNAKPEEKDYIDFFEDVEKGLYGIAENTAYSVGDLATTGIDAVAGTDLNEKITETFEENKLDSPETLIGKATELIGTYTIGGGAAFKILNRVKKLATVKKGKALVAATAGKKVSDIAGKAGILETDLSLQLKGL
jgi:hypothetical protein